MPTPVLEYIPSYTYDVSPEFRTGVSRSVSGSEQRVELPGGGKNVWTLIFSHLSATDFAGLKAFYAARKGRFEAFNWVCLLDGQTYLVRFGADKLNFRNEDKLKYSVTLTLVEVDA